MTSAEASGDRWSVWLLAIGQTLVYSGCYYSFPALLPDLEAATGWSKSTLALGPTLAFLIMAVLTPLTGRIVDRGWGGEILTLGPLLVALGVAGLGLARSEAVWLCAWALIGVAQSGCLYETCFAFLTRRLGAGARSAITKVTLVAGFAGTLTFPLGHWLGAALGGQGALLVFASFVLVVVPVNLVAVRRLRRKARAAGVAPMPDAPGALRRAMANPAFWAIGGAIGLIWLNHSVLLTYVLPLFVERGSSPAVAALAAACIGPAQVAGRLALLLAGARISTGLATRAAMLSVVAAAVLLWLAGAAWPLIFVFALLQGAGVGLLSILRPVLIADVLGREGFGAISGAVAVAPILATAAGPTVGAALLAEGGPGLVLAATLTMAIAGTGLGFWLLARRAAGA